MGRSFQFSTPAQAHARVRQMGLCACCGDSLDDVEEDAHHVVPNQSGNPRDPGHRWLAGPDNCVVLCHVCHERVHADGRYRSGAVAPPSYFPHSHGTSRASHEVWARKLAQASKSIWGI